MAETATGMEANVWMMGQDPGGTGRNDQGEVTGQDLTAASIRNPVSAEE
jgi:hypothetical protein